VRRALSQRCPKFSAVLPAPYCGASVKCPENRWVRRASAVQRDPGLPGAVPGTRRGTAS